MRFFDTHAHIHDRDFAGEQGAVIERAREAGVVAILTLGVTHENSIRALDLARRRREVWAAVGVHPHDAAEASHEDLDALEEMAGDPRVVAIGELGLDFYRDLSPRESQIRVLCRQLETATRVVKPVAVHARDAHDDMLPILTDWSTSMRGHLPDGGPLGVMHYFSEDAVMAARYVALGFIISVHTSVTHPKADRLREVVRETPLEYLVVETDSPYGAPQRVRGKRNEPAYVADAAAKVAEIKGLPVEIVAETTTRNAMNLFGIEAGAA